MKLLSLKRVLAVAAIIGLIIPRALLSYQVGHFAPLLTRALWPTAPSLIVMDGYQQSPSSYMLVLAAVAGNVLAYALAFGFLWFLVRSLTGAKRSLRNGTNI
jgi:amino acid transporter